MRNGEIKVRTFEEVGVVLTRWARRQSPHIVGLLPPIMVHFDAPKVDKDGLIGRRLFHTNGTIQSVGIYIPGVDKDHKPSVNFEVTDPTLMAMSRTIKVGTKFITGECNMAIISGTILTVRIDDPTMTDILVSVTFLPHVSDYKAINQLYAEIESKADERIRDAVNQIALTGTTGGQSESGELSGVNPVQEPPTG